MARTIDADGDRWSVRLSERPAGPGVHAILFFCRTTDQRPYRVVEVPSERIDGQGDLETLSGEDLRELFRASRSMGFPQSYPTYS